MLPVPKTFPGMQEKLHPQSIRVATWNMAYWQHREMLNDAWNCYLHTAQADFYLFQEGRPYPVAQQRHLIWSEIGGKRDWGSGIYSPIHEIKEEDIGGSFKGVVTIGETVLEKLPLTLISLYGKMESDGPAKGYSIPNLHRIFSDLTGLLNGHMDGKRNIILGGDFNASTQFDKAQNNRSHELLFARVEDFGLQNAYTLAGNKNHVQTLRRPDSTEPWQDDYLFVSKLFAKGFKSCEVIDTPDVRQFSDHNIVLVEVLLPSRGS